jgi:hypothetical protein
MPDAAERPPVIRHAGGLASSIAPPMRRCSSFACIRRFSAAGSFRLNCLTRRSFDRSGIVQLLIWKSIPGVALHASTKSLPMSKRHYLRKNRLSSHPVRLTPEKMQTRAPNASQPNHFVSFRTLSVEVAVLVSAPFKEFIFHHSSNRASRSRSSAFKPYPVLADRASWPT